MMHLIDAGGGAGARSRRAAAFKSFRAVRVCLAAGFTFLVMRQVLPIAAGLASGVALSTFGIVSGALANASRRRTFFSAGRVYAWGAHGPGDHPLGIPCQPQSGWHVAQRQGPLGLAQR